MSERIVEHSEEPQMRREIVKAIQPVLVERIKGRVADQMVDIPVPQVMEGIVAVEQEEVVLAPDGTSGTVDCRAGASATDLGRG